MFHFGVERDDDDGDDDEFVEEDEGVEASSKILTRFLRFLEGSLVEGERMVPHV
jgi:hypothetical protein